MGKRKFEGRRIAKRVEEKAMIVKASPKDNWNRRGGI